MKKYIMGIAAIVLAVSFSAFSFAPTSIVYMFYKTGNPDQKQISSFDQTTTLPTCNPGTALCYGEVNDGNGVITQTEWYNGLNPNAGYFEQLDVVNDGSDILDDETAAVVGHRN